MKRVTLKSTVAAIAITSAAAAWAQTDLNADANADVSADSDVSTSVDNALEDSGDAVSNTAEEVGDAITDTSEAIADTAEDAYESTTDTADAATEDTDADVNAEVTAETSTEETGTDADAEIAADAQSDDGMAETDTEMTADSQADGTAPDAEMVDSFSGMTVADVVGQSVIEANGSEVGEVDHVIQNSGETEVVIGMGGFLGIGQHDVAVPLSQLTQGADGTLQLSDMTQEELNLMPEVDMDSVTEMQSDQPI